MTAPLPYVLRTRVDALLEPGEKALAGAHTALPLAGTEAIIEPPREAAPSPEEPPMTAGEKAVGALVLVAAAAIAPVGWSGGKWPGRLNRLLNGYRVRGVRDSIAVRLFERLESARRTTYAVVTDRRLAVAYAQGVTSSSPLIPLADIPRSEIVAARRRGRPTSRGRVELSFRDGSMVAIMTGILSARRADAIVAALELPKNPPV